MKKVFAAVLCLLLCISSSVFAGTVIRPTERIILLRAMLRTEVRTTVYQETDFVQVVFDENENAKRITIFDKNNVVCYENYIDNAVQQQGELLINIDFLASGEYKIVIDIESLGKCQGDFEK